VPNYRTRHRTEESLPAFIQENKPTPDPSIFNIFVFHMALDLPSVTPAYIEAEASPELIPDGFDYYAAGHVHKAYRERFKTGLLAYSGCIETTDYVEASMEKGFYHLKVDTNKTATSDFIRLDSMREFAVFEQDFTGINPPKITEQAAQLVKDADEDGIVIVPVLRGTLPSEANRADVDIARIRAAAQKALLVHPIVQLRESEVPEEVVRSIFESKITDLKTKAFEYFRQIFSERYGEAEAEIVARAAVNLIEPLTKKQEAKVKETIEELLK
jgi:DNA repair exonuclease SbcCD nuclease subunit